MMLRKSQAKNQLFAFMFALASRATLSLAQVGGISSCRGQLPAIDNSLLDPSKDIRPGLFQDVDAVVSLGGVVLDRTSLTEFPINTNLRVEISSPSFEMMGVFIRIARTFEEDATGALTPGAGMEVATQCEAPVAGIVSRSARAKSVVNGRLRFNETTLALLEATIVYRNDDTISAFVYDSFALSFVGAPPPVPSPPSTPTVPGAPTMSPTRSMVEPPTKPNATANPTRSVAGPVGRATENPTRSEAR